MWGASHPSFLQWWAVYICFTNSRFREGMVKVESCKRNKLWGCFTLYSYLSFVVCCLFLCLFVNLFACSFACWTINLEMRVLFPLSIFLSYMRLSCVSNWMGDHLGIHSAVYLILKCNSNSQMYIYLWHGMVRPADQVETILSIPHTTVVPPIQLD